VTEKISVVGLVSVKLGARYS